MRSPITALSACLGVASASIAARLPARAEAIETISGFLLIAGLALIGSALPAAL
ncbi:MAG TPA: hypothetical protein VFA57_16060 [Pseudolabrys sp.]|nr:hypothetical protein [Pseudolabrys sp.]